MRALLLIVLFLTVLMSCVRQAPMQYAEGSVWGTTYHIKYRADRDLSDSIVQVMNRVDMSLSPFQPMSLVSRINRGERVQADSMLIHVIDLSQEVCRLSGGAFDPTLAPLINLWGFGYREGSTLTPSPAQIDSALTSVGILACGIDEEGYVIRKSDATEFNFSAIAKGYGVDCIAEMLRRCGCTDYMVEVGGEIALRGNGPSGDGWRIQVDAPVPDSLGVNHERLKVLTLTDACIATSGNYRNFHRTADGTIGHTISPVTGYPVQTSTLSATVIAPSTALADALATAIMAMPDSAAQAMLSTLPDIETIIVTAP